MSITQTMAPGTSLDATMAAASKVEEVLKNTEGVEIYQVTGGSTGSLFGAGGGTNASSSQAAFAITTDPDADKNAIMDEVRAEVAELQNAGTITRDRRRLLGGHGRHVADGGARLGRRPRRTQGGQRHVLAEVETVDGLADVNSNLSEGRPSATIVVDQAKAAAAGVTPATLSQYTTLVLNGYPLGMVPTAAGTLPAQVMVGEIKVPPLPGAVSQVLTQLPVPGTARHGAAGRDRQGRRSQGAGAGDPRRRRAHGEHHGDRRRTTTSARPPRAVDQGARRRASCPQGATWELAGATEATNDVFRTLGIAMLVAILLVYIIMVATFRSLLNPLILLVSIPFAAVGAVLALVITGTSLGMPSLVGLLMLIGIVVTNAIVLLDLVEQFRRRGMDARTAVIEGGRRRLRPILMTAIATILALIPMALGIGGKGGFLSTPLAIVVIGGLFTSTFLTLILVPVLYLAFDRLRPAGAYARTKRTTPRSRRSRHRPTDGAASARGRRSGPTPG